MAEDNEMQEKIGSMLLKGLVDLREQKSDITFDDLGALFLSTAATIDAATSPTEAFMHKEIRRLSQYITGAKNEIFAMSSQDKREAALMDASQHLDEVIKATEKATHIIMDAADAIQTAAAGIGGAKEQQIMTATNRIYETCNFQDITGQRITRVIKLLTHIDERIAKLNALFSTREDESTRGTAYDAMGERHLLNGPQLAANAASQQEIDQLLARIDESNT